MCSRLWTSAVAAISSRSSRASAVSRSSPVLHAAAGQHPVRVLAGADPLDGQQVTVGCDQQGANADGHAPPIDGSAAPSQMLARLATSLPGLATGVRPGRWRTSQARSTWRAPVRPVWPGKRPRPDRSSGQGDHPEHADARNGRKLAARVTTRCAARAKVTGQPAKQRASAA